MSVFNSITVPVILVLLFAGLATGLSVSGIDLLNPNTSTAEARRMNVETKHQEAMNQLEERIVSAKTDAEIQAIKWEQERLEAEHQRDLRIIEQDLANRQIAFTIRMLLLIIAVSAISIALIIATFLWVGSKAIVRVKTADPNPMATPSPVPPVSKVVQPLPEREPYEPWESEEYRRAKIKEARYRERTDRKAELGKDRDKLPLGV